MRRKRDMRNKIYLMACLLCGLAGASEMPADRIPALETAVAGNLGTEQGKKYADSVNVFFREKLSAPLKACRDSIAGEKTSGFAVFLMFNRRGGAKDLVLHPVSKVGECLAAAARRETFPEPPGGNYWVKAEMAGSPPK